MESELFDWESWDGDPEAMIYMNCTLKVPIGMFKIGDKIPSICIGYEKGIIQFFDESGEKPILQAKIRFEIGDLIM